AAAAEAARKQYIADNGFGACRYNLEGVGPYVDYTTLGDCRDSKRGTFKAGATYAQVDAENLAIINASMVRCTLPDGTVFPKDTKEHCAVLKGRVG
ncbi:MAG TPA: hypothetical protein VFF24_00705, partial [Acidimicrobiia bacterium]|nr:hypothetical protein [Acidimicrobiia bacterium]